MTVTGNEEDISRFYVEEFNDAPEWAYEIYVKGVEGIQFRLWSRWQPDFVWLEGLLKKYPSLWVKNIWREEGGMAGVWIGGGDSSRNSKDGIKRLEWDDMCIEENAHRFRTG